MPQTVKETNKQIAEATFTRRTKNQVQIILLWSHDAKTQFPGEASNVGKGGRVEDDNQEKGG